jgi:hypothetical protein
VRLGLPLRFLPGRQGPYFPRCTYSLRLPQDLLLHPNPYQGVYGLYRMHVFPLPIEYPPAQKVLPTSFWLIMGACIASALFKISPGTDIHHDSCGLHTPHKSP